MRLTDDQIRIPTEGAAYTVRGRTRVVTRVFKPLASKSPVRRLAGRWLYGRRYSPDVLIGWRRPGFVGRGRDWKRERGEAGTCTPRAWMEWILSDRRRRGAFK